MYRIQQFLVERRAILAILAVLLGNFGIIWCILMLVWLLVQGVATPAHASAIIYGPAPGYAAGTTGGGADAPTCLFTDKASLEGCLAGDSPAIVLPGRDNVQVYLTAKERIPVGSNKTLDGMGQLRLAPDLYGLSLVGVHNDIIRNVWLRGSGYTPAGSLCNVPYTAMVDAKLFYCAVPLQIISSNHVWIDHVACKLYVDKCFTGWANNGPTPIAPTDAIAITNSRVSYAFYSALFGIDAAVPFANLPPVGHVTFYNNIFSHTMRRDPRCSIDYVCDVTQNVIYSWGGKGCAGNSWGFGPSSESSVMLLRNNWIEAEPGTCTEALNIQAEDAIKSGRRGPMGQITLDHNILVGGATTTLPPLPVPDFHPPYTLPLLSVWHVEDALHLTAGVITTATGH